MSTTRGTTALDALLNSPVLAFARTRIAAWKKYDPKLDIIPPDAVNALAIALQAIDLLLAERTPADKAVSWITQRGLGHTVDNNIIIEADEPTVDNLIDLGKAPYRVTVEKLSEHAPAQPSAPVVAASPAVVCTLCGSTDTVKIGPKNYGCHSCGEEFHPGEPHYRYEMTFDANGNLESREIEIPVHPSAVAVAAQPEAATGCAAQQGTAEGVRAGGNYVNT